MLHRDLPRDEVVGFLRISSHPANQQESSVRATQRRLKVTTIFLYNIKMAKMMDLEKHMDHSVEDLRLDEISVAKGYGAMEIITVVLCKSAYQIDP